VLPRTRADDPHSERASGVAPVSVRRVYRPTHLRSTVRAAPPFNPPPCHGKLLRPRAAFHLPTAQAYAPLAIVAPVRRPCQTRSGTLFSARIWSAERTIWDGCGTVGNGCGTVGDGCGRVWARCRGVWAGCGPVRGRAAAERGHIRDFSVPAVRRRLSRGAKCSRPPNERDVVVKDDEAQQSATNLSISEIDLSPAKIGPRSRFGRRPHYAPSGSSGTAIGSGGRL
jgi:hypothetical protein